MEKTYLMPHPSVYTNEHDAWIRMFKKMAEILGLSEEELNEEKFKPIFIEIERWAYFDRVRRETMKETDNWNPEWDTQGVFWNGD